MSILYRLPNELLQLIFDDLDQPTLCELTRMSRSLNEPASRSLYRYTVVNPDRSPPRQVDETSRYSFAARHRGKTPFAAFERRPHLRNAVRRVRIYSPFSVITILEFVAFIHEIELLKGVKTVEIMRGFIPRELSLLFNALYQLPGPLLLIVSDAPEVLRCLDPPPNKNIQVATDLVNLIESGSTTSIPAISNLEVVRWDSDLNFLRNNVKSFRSLHTLMLKLPVPADMILDLIAPLKALCTLIFICEENGNMSPQYSPLALTRLKDLRIRFRNMDESKLKGYLEPIMQCIAGDSHLERLDIKCSANKATVLGTHDSEFITRIISPHSKTLIKLKFPIACPSESHLEDILVNFTSLRALWIGVDRGLMGRMSILLPLSSRLSTLRLYSWDTLELDYTKVLSNQDQIPGDPRFTVWCTTLQKSKEFDNVESLLYQDDCGIQKFKTCTFVSTDLFCEHLDSWGVSWSYDNIEGRASRSIKHLGMAYSKACNWSESPMVNTGYFGSPRGRWIEMAFWISQYAPKGRSSGNTSWRKRTRSAVSIDKNGKVFTWPEADDLSEYLT